VSDRRSSPDLGSSAEAALATFPFPERDWERDARAIEARISYSTRGSTEASLLASPLPPEADEPSALSATATPLTNSGVRTQSLAELARRSVEKKQATERQIARESLALAAQQRQHPLPQDAPSAHAPRAVATNPVEHSPLASRQSKPFPKVAWALPAIALAAAVALWFRAPGPEPQADPAIAQPTPGAAVTSAPSAREIARAQPSAMPDSPRGIDPSMLPEQRALASDSATVAAAPAPPVAAAPSRTTGAKTGAKADRAAASSADQGLPPDPALRPADSRGGELPAKPSTGAVQAALGAVMSGARHCVAGDDAPSRAVVVFGSDGRVQQVTVSGSAAGKSSASCIEAQLSRARVQPFAASSFSVNATVRPE